MDSESNIPITPPDKRRFTRRTFLEGVVATGLATVGAATVLNWTEPVQQQEVENHENKSILNKDFFKQHLYPISDEQLIQVTHEYENDLNPQNLDIENLPHAWGNIMEGFDHIEAIRNRAIFQPEDVSRVVDMLRKYNTLEPFKGLIKDGIIPREKIDNKVLKANHLNVLKYEAYMALRYLTGRGLVDKSVLNEFQLDGAVGYFYTDIFGLSNMTYLGKNNKYKYPLDEFKFDSADPAKDNLKHTDALIQKHWNKIVVAGKEFGIDPYFIASLISMEARDEKLYNLYWNSAEEKNQKWIAEYLMKDRPEANSFKAKIIEKLYWINNHEWTQSFLPDVIPEAWIDNISGILGQNNSIGLGQLRPGNMKNIDFMRLFANRKVKEDAPDSFWAALLTILDVNIRATAATVKQLTNEYQQLEHEGFNLYLPDLAVNNPTSEHSQNNLLDPYFGTNFGVAAYGQWYNDGPYPEEMDPNPHTIEHVVKLRDAQIQLWGSSVAKYVDYYRNNAERLQLHMN